MKACKLFFIVILCSLNYFIQGQNITGGCSVSLCTTNPFRIDTTNLFSPAVKRIGYFWYFGDGQWTTESTPMHQFSTNLSSHLDLLYVELTPIDLYFGSKYDDDDVPKRYYNPGTRQLSTGSMFYPVNAATTSNIPMPSNSIEITKNRNLVEGDSVTYIITYESSCGDVASGETFITFNYNNTYLGNEELPLPANFNSFNSYTSPSSNQIVFDVPSHTGGQKRHILVRMKVKEDLSLNTPINVSATLVNEKNECNSFATETSSTVKSHDPNKIGTDLDYSCLSPQVGQVFKYYIRFQNIGNGPATYVKINNFIPDHFDINSLVTLPMQSSGTVPSFTVNPTSRLVTWELNSCDLKGCPLDLIGTNQDGIGSQYSLNDTFDTLFYEIKLDRKLNRCDAIVNQAQIFFDTNDPIWTDPFVTTIGCYPNLFTDDGTDLPPLDSTAIERCLVCKNPSILENGDSLKIYSGDPLTLNVDDSLLPNPAIPANHHFQWYPSYKLSDPNIQNPVACPCQNTHYYLVATSTNNCKRTIIHFPVKVDGNPCSSLPNWIWWAVGVLAIFLLAFLLKKFI